MNRLNKTHKKRHIKKDTLKQNILKQDILKQDTRHNLAATGTDWVRCLLLSLINQELELELELGCDHDNHYY